MIALTFQLLLYLYAVLISYFNILIVTYIISVSTVSLLLLSSLFNIWRKYGRLLILNVTIAMLSFHLAWSSLYEDFPIYKQLKSSVLMHEIEEFTFPKDLQLTVDANAGFHVISNHKLPIHIQIPPSLQPLFRQKGMIKMSSTPLITFYSRNECSKGIKRKDSIFLYCQNGKMYMKIKQKNSFDFEYMPILLLRLIVETFPEVRGLYDYNWYKSLMNQLKPFLLSLMDEQNSSLSSFILLMSQLKIVYMILMDVGFTAIISGILFFLVFRLLHFVAPEMFEKPKTAVCIQVQLHVIMFGMFLNLYSNRPLLTISSGFIILFFHLKVPRIYMQHQQPQQLPNQQQQLPFQNQQQQLPVQNQQQQQLLFENQQQLPFQNQQQQLPVQNQQQQLPFQNQQQQQLLFETQEQQQQLLSIPQQQQDLMNCSSLIFSTPILSCREFVKVYSTLWLNRFHSHGILYNHSSISKLS